MSSAIKTGPVLGGLPQLHQFRLGVFSPGLVRQLSTLRKRLSNLSQARWRASSGSTPDIWAILAAMKRASPTSPPGRRGDCPRRRRIQSSPQLPNLLQLVQGAEGAGPVEAGLGGLALDLLRPPQGGQGVGARPPPRRRWTAGPSLLALEGLPVHHSTCSEVSACPWCRQRHGVAVDQLLGHAVHHVLHGEAAGLRFDLGVEHHLHQHVAQLLAHGVGSSRSMASSTS